MSWFQLFILLLVYSTLSHSIFGMFTLFYNVFIKILVCISVVWCCITSPLIFAYKGSPSRRIYYNIGMYSCCTMLHSKSIYFHLQRVAVSFCTQPCLKLSWVVGKFEGSHHEVQPLHPLHLLFQCLGRQTPEIPQEGLRYLHQF